MSAIVTEHLSKWYGQVSALNDVSVTVPPGITGLLGPNGAGKSTLMKLLTGQLRPSAGRVRVLGEPVWGNPGLFARVGLCPEQDGLPDRLTGIEWVADLLRLNGFPHEAAGAAARRALDTVGLADDRTRKLGACSKGVRQRVKLAQAIAHDPELLILDEPLTGMDPLARRRTIRLIRDWGAAGRTILVSSHILHEVEAMTSNILLVNHGRIVAEGDVHQIRALIDSRPHRVRIGSDSPRPLAARVCREPGVVSVRIEPRALVVETELPDSFYTAITAIAADTEYGRIDEVSSPDDNLQAVFDYLVTP